MLNRIAGRQGRARSRAGLEARGPDEDDPEVL